VLKGVEEKAPEERELV